MLDGTSLTLPKIMEIAKQIWRQRNMHRSDYEREVVGYIGHRAMHSLIYAAMDFTLGSCYVQRVPNDDILLGYLRLHPPNQFFAAASNVISIHWEYDPEIEYPGCHAIIAFPFPDERQRREYAMKIFNEYKTPVDPKLEKP